MSLRNQPYLPLYIQDFLTDEKLIECSAQATGVYIRLMCIMHKSDEYGKILLKQKDKQTDNQIKNFALKLAKQMPYSENIIFDGINELISENVIFIDNDYLVQKRMVADNDLSEKRSMAGKKGGGNPNFVKTNLQTTSQTNTESEIDNEDVNKNETINESIKMYIESFNKIRNTKFKVLPKSARQVFKETLKHYSVDEIITAYKNALKAQNHIDNGFQYLTPEFFTRINKIEMYINFKPKVLGQ